MKPLGNMMGYPGKVKQVLNSEDSDNPYDVKDVIRFEVPGVTDNLSKFPFALPLQNSDSEIMEGDPVFVIQPSQTFKTWFYIKINRQEFFGISTRTEEQFIKLWDSFNDDNKKKGIEVLDKFGNKFFSEKDIITIETQWGDKTTIDKDGKRYVEDRNGNKSTVDDKGIEAEDLNGNKVTFASAGITIKDKNGNEVQMTSSGLTIKDKNGNEVQMTAAGIKLKTTDASPWMPNIIPVCPFGAPHGGPGAGIVKLTGG